MASWRDAQFCSFLEYGVMTGSSLIETNNAKRTAMKKISKTREFTRDYMADLCKV